MSERKTGTLKDRVAEDAAEYIALADLWAEEYLGDGSQD